MLPSFLFAIHTRLVPVFLSIVTKVSSYPLVGTVLSRTKYSRNTTLVGQSKMLRYRDEACLLK
jgi:hypothetical protein